MYVLIIHTITLEFVLHVMKHALNVMVLQIVIAKNVNMGIYYKVQLVILHAQVQNMQIFL